MLRRFAAQHDMIDERLRRHLLPPQFYLSYRIALTVMMHIMNGYNSKILTKVTEKVIIYA